MNEPTAARPVGSDVAWTDWRATTTPSEAPRPDAVRPEAASGRVANIATENQAGKDTGGRSQDKPKESADAVFPTSYARFSIDSETQRLSIKIVDARTDEVIREIPSEQVQRIAAELQAAAQRNIAGKRPASASGHGAATNGGIDRYV